jgi:hypothetical protein
MLSVDHPDAQNRMTAHARLNNIPRTSAAGTACIEEARVKTPCALAVALFAAALFAVAAAPPVLAQEQQSFKAIVGKGYEIKSVTFARGEATENREIFLVTLQKDKSVAVCYFAAATWINLSPAALEDSKRCDVR